MPEPRRKEVFDATVWQIPEACIETCHFIHLNIHRKIKQPHVLILSCLRMNRMGRWHGWNQIAGWKDAQAHSWQDPPGKYVTICLSFCLSLYSQSIASDKLSRKVVTHIIGPNLCIIREQRHRSFVWGNILRTTSGLANAENPAFLVSYSVLLHLLCTGSHFGCGTTDCISEGRSVIHPLIL